MDKYKKSMDRVTMKISYLKTSVLLPTLMASMILGTTHYSFATKAPMPDLLSNLPKELQAEIEKYKERKYIKASDLTQDNVDGYKKYDTLGLDLDRSDDETMKLVSRLTNLQAISVRATSGSGWGITDNVLKYLKDLKNLKSIVLTRSRITDAGLEDLKDLANLEFINLNDTDITDAGLARLKNLTNLKKIFLRGAKVSDAGLASLENLKKLEFIDLCGTRITDAGLVSIQNLRNLKYIDLSYNGSITDAGLASLENLKKLEFINLSTTGMTDAGLARLKNLTNLKKIIVAHKVTQPGEEEFRKSLPKVIIGR